MTSGTSRTLEGVDQLARLLAYVQTPEQTRAHNEDHILTVLLDPRSHSLDRHAASRCRGGGPKWTQRSQEIPHEPGLFDLRDREPPSGSREVDDVATSQTVDLAEKDLRSDP